MSVPVLSGAGSMTSYSIRRRRSLPGLAGGLACSEFAEIVGELASVSHFPDVTAARPLIRSNGGPSNVVHPRP